MEQKVRAAVIGIGGMSHGHIRSMIRLGTQIVAVCDPSPAAYDRVKLTFVEMEAPIPPHYTDLHAMLEATRGNLDAVVIITPHAYHHDQAKACMEAGIDVLLEKPMVMNVAEAQSLIETRDRTGKLLVIAFQGSLSPRIRHAVTMLQSGELGEMLNISGTVWQNWKELNNNTWRTVPELSGGGFLFDTGAHMLNTVADLAGQDFAEVAAWTDNRGSTVELIGAVIGKLKSGALVTINACGETVVSCSSDIRVFCTKGILRTGQWGERLELQRAGRKVLRTVEVPASLGVWEQFLLVRAGQIANPSPPEIGLRMTRLWDAIKESAANGGSVVKTLA